MDRLAAMQTFVRVVESGSFSAVAREARATHSTGRSWGERGGTTGARAATARSGRRSKAALCKCRLHRSPAAAALRPTCHQADPWAATGEAVEPQRADSVTGLGFRRPGFGLGKWPG